jgi:predicted nucleotidyltransferase
VGVVDVFRVAAILVEHVRRSYAEDVALVAYYGSRARGTARDDSDLDIFFVPSGPGARSPACGFVLDGIPFDFWPVSWQLLEDIAEGRGTRPWAVAASLLADARVLHSRSPAEAERFTALQERVAALTTPDHRAEAVDRADDAYAAMLRHLGEVRLAIVRDDTAGMRWAAWHLVNAAFNCLALVNQRWFTEGWGASQAQALALPTRPDDLEELVEVLTTSPHPDAVTAAAEHLADAVGRIIQGARAASSGATDPRVVFANAYAEIHEHCLKVAAACARGDRPAAAAAAFQIHNEVAAMVQAPRGARPGNADLMGDTTASYRAVGFPDLADAAMAGDLESLAARARDLDDAIRSWLEQRRVTVNVFADEADLMRFLAAREADVP